MVGEMLVHAVKSLKFQFAIARLNREYLRIIILDLSVCAEPIKVACSCSYISQQTLPRLHAHSGVECRRSDRYWIRLAIEIGGWTIRGLARRAQRSAGALQRLRLRQWLQLAALAFALAFLTCTVPFIHQLMPSVGDLACKLMQRHVRSHRRLALTVCIDEEPYATVRYSPLCDSAAPPSAVGGTAPGIPARWTAHTHGATLQRHAGEFLMTCCSHFGS